MAGCRVVMRFNLAYLVAIVLVFSPVSLLAQSRGFISREALDSLVNPNNSERGAGALLLSHTTVELGDIDSSERVYFGFEVKNTTNRPVAITEFRTSCGCIEVQTRPQSIEPGATLMVGACFNPVGRSSAFSYRVNLYTNLDSELPTERVMVTGRVVSEDKWSHLPMRMGALRLSRKEVTLDSQGQERIAVANGGDCAVTVTAKSTVEGLVLRCEPEVLGPNQEGDIFIRYGGDIFHDLTTILIIEGVEASPAERIIKVKLKR